jgi:hypothetical protein
MSDRERLQAQQEAKSAAQAMSSADRARLWAGMNRYLAAELEREKKQERDEEQAKDQKKSSRSS